MRFFKWLALILAVATYSVPATAKDYGGCQFNKSREQFRGDKATQLNCLLRRVKIRGAGADPQPIPAWLTNNVWEVPKVTADKLAAYLSERNLSQSVTVPGPQISRPRLRYFVIHDTSSPEINGTNLPAEIDTPEYNRRLLCCAFSSVRKKVNLIIGRDGASRLTIDWGAPRPSAATKIEMNSRAASARPIFVHVENIQPRAKPAGSWAWIAPDPGLTPAQEERLALAYIVASVRAGRWLMPAYHFNIDAGLPDGHDDPQKMNLPGWTAQVEKIVGEIG